MLLLTAGRVLGHCWDHQLTSPLPLLCLFAVLVTQKLIHSAGLAEDAWLMWRQRHRGCWSTAVPLPAHKTFPPKLQKLIHGWYPAADNSDKDLWNKQEIPPVPAACRTGQQTTCKKTQALSFSSSDPDFQSYLFPPSLPSTLGCFK